MSWHGGEAGCEILVRDVWENRTAYKASFYVREASGIKHIEELRGRTVAFVDPASSSGYIYPMAAADEARAGP